MAANTAAGHSGEKCLQTFALFFSLAWIHFIGLGFLVLYDLVMHLLFFSNTQSQSPLPTVQLAVSVLQDLLQYSSQLPELAREVGLNSILGILTSLLSLKSEVICMHVLVTCRFTSIKFTL